MSAAKVIKGVRISVGAYFRAFFKHICSLPVVHRPKGALLVLLVLNGVTGVEWSSRAWVRTIF